MFNQVFTTPDINIGDFIDIPGSYDPTTDSFPNLFANTYSLKSKVTRIKKETLSGKLNNGTVLSDIDFLNNSLGLN